MKLSEMSTEKAFDAMAELCIPVGNLADDAELLAQIQELAKYKTNGEKLAQTVAKIAKNVFPLVFKRHKDDVFSIVSVLMDKPIDTVKTQKVNETIEDMKTCLDKDFFDFFASSVATEQPE